MPPSLFSGATGRLDCLQSIVAPQHPCIHPVDTHVSSDGAQQSITQCNERGQNPGIRRGGSPCPCKNTTLKFCNSSNEEKGSFHRPRTTPLGWAPAAATSATDISGGGAHARKGATTLIFPTSQTRVLEALAIAVSSSRVRCLTNTPNTERVRLFSIVICIAREPNGVGGKMQRLKAQRQSRGADLDIPTRCIHDAVRK